MLVNSSCHFCVSLTFLHPIRYEPVTVTAPLPSHWQPWIEGLQRE
jgi:hypothetical protein